MSQIPLDLSPTTPVRKVKQRPPAATKDPQTLQLLTAVIPPLDGEFLYYYDPKAHPHLDVGYVIDLPLGRRETPGFIISINSERETQAKAEIDTRNVKLKSIPDDTKSAHAFTKEHLEFYQWISRYYSEPLSKILDLAVPARATEKPKEYFTLSDNPRTESEERSNKRGAPSQAKVLELLASSNNTPLEANFIRERSGASSSTIKTLLERGLIERAKPLVDNRNPSLDSYLAKLELSIPDLNGEQSAAFNTIRQDLDSFSTTLLQGVTGSGKTEVYLALIISLLKQGRSALVIVPEIALTPQLTERFISRLKLPVAVLHSSLKPKQRWQHWSDLLSGRVRVAIGARSAIFAPLANLGIIVVDEEHDSSFKQGEGIRYHARDLALVRAKFSKCPVVLGSATPSLESYHHAKSGRYRHLYLNERYHDAATSTYDIVDLNAIPPWKMRSRSVSPNLLRGLEATLQKGGQSFVLYNKRGFASYLQCSKCGYAIGCPNCSVTLKLHQKTNTLLCHQCDYRMVPPSLCTGCGAKDELSGEGKPIFSLRGSGTERVHEELAQLLPSARIAVLDRDTASNVDDYTEILGSVRERKVDILVGTQMIAKGHDLPGVVFVGIVDCDVGLHIPDFRAAEKSFQLLTQVAGRAGRRSEQGHIVMQTRVPKHPSLTLTVSKDFDKFAENELKLREQLCYPPFFKMLRIIVSASEQSLALNYAASVARTAQLLRERFSVEVLGPAPAPIERVKTLWRYHLLLRARSAANLQHAMKQLKLRHHTKGDIRVAYDLDPHDML
jgi:primosomal protein N' (replication factor Y)